MRNNIVNVEKKQDNDAISNKNMLVIFVILLFTWLFKSSSNRLFFQNFSGVLNVHKYDNFKERLRDIQFITFV